MNPVSLAIDNQWIQEFDPRTLSIDFKRVEELNMGSSTIVQ